MAFPPLLRLLSLLLALTLTLNLTACSAPPNPDQLALAILSDPKTFNAVLSQESPNIFSLTYEGLIRENPLTGVKEPALAASWQISEDAKTITFTLRENLRWSDGEPLTVEDVLFVSVQGGDQLRTKRVKPLLGMIFRDFFQKRRHGSI
jgi:peptide/nickel transport system substrate-binding protein